MAAKDLEEMIQDPTVSDEDVYQEFTKAEGSDPAPDRVRDGLTEEEFRERMEAWQQKVEQQGELLYKHRKAVARRVERDVAHGHSDCCGPGSKKRR